MRVDVTDAEGRRIADRGLARWLSRHAPPGVTGTMTIALVSDALMRRLNRQFRGKDTPTDVLSFANRPQASGLGPQGAGVRPQALGPRPQKITREADRRPRGQLKEGFLRPEAWGLGPDLGEVAIATGIARRQARRFGHSEATELRVLALHGLLHLLGYDHDADQGEMEQLEERLRRRAGLPGGLITRPRRATRG